MTRVRARIRYSIDRIELMQRLQREAAFALQKIEREFDFLSRF